MKIVGAGLAGLLAATAWPTAEVFEAEPEPRAIHKALLRFRTEAVARMVGMEFREVTVRKGLWVGGRFVQPNIRFANWYVQKVTGSLIGDRSVWNLDAVQRFIAPEDFYMRMVELVANRIHWGSPYDFKNHNPKEPIISTAPLPIVLDALGEQKPYRLSRASIRVERFRIPDADLHQTIYFPEPILPIYRASITGSLLICEYSELQGSAASTEEVRAAFGLGTASLEKLDSVSQKYGKIIPLPAAERRALLHKLTVQHGIFSIGRFATWRNVLLDDVVQDIDVVRRLIRASGYERSLFAAI